MLHTFRKIIPLASGSLCLAIALSPSVSLGQNDVPQRGEAAVLPVAAPDTSAGRQLDEWLEAFNAADSERLATIVGRFSGTPTPTVQGMLGLRQRSGGFDLRKIEQSTDTGLVVLAQERGSDQFVRITVELDAAPDYRIRSLAPRAVERPPEFAIVRLDDRQLAEQLDAKLASMAEADEFSGAVIIQRDGKPVFGRAYGLADRDRQLPNELESKFRFGSMGKMFTGTAAMQLVQAGKIDLSDPIGKYLPDYPNADVAKVTIEQLLTHTGGTGDIFTQEFFDRAGQIEDLHDYVEVFGTRGTKFVPGSRYEYSNYGYILLGRVIEAASGMDYYEYVQRNIFDPAGMTSTGFWPESQPLRGRVNGYDRTPQGFRIVQGTPTDRASPAGGGVSTVGDMMRFAGALLDHKLLDAEHTGELLSGTVQMSPNAKYAFGFADVGRGTPLHHVGHNGGAPGQSGDLQIYPEAGYAVVVLSNLDNPAAQRVSDFIANRLKV